MEIDLVNVHDLSFFVYTNDSAYGIIPESSKHYSVQQHFIELKNKIIDLDSYFNPTFSKDFDKYFSLISLRIFRKLVDHYWRNNVNFSIVDVGCQYGFFSMKLGNYIKGHNHHNKIYAFDCGLAGKLTEY